MHYDYSQVTAKSVADVTAAGLAAANDIVESIVAATESTPAAILQPLDDVTALLTVTYGQGAFMARVHPDEEVRAAGATAEETISKWRVDLVSRRDLYEAVRDFAAAGPDVDPAQRRLLDFWLRDFRRAGHELEAAARNRLTEMRARLVELEVEFQKNIDAYEDGIEATPQDLAGLSEGLMDRLDQGSRDGTLRVTLDYPQYFPFMQQAERRDLRQELQTKFYNQAVDANRPLLAEAVALRGGMAELLGHPTWAHYAMEPKMADPESVDKMYADLVPRVTDKAKGELRELTDLAEADGAERLESWDWSFYDNRQRVTDYGIDAEEVAAYFPLEQVFSGMFDITGEVFGLSYHRLDDVATWHPEVRVYEIRDRNSGNPLAVFYADLFPRQGKFGHAAAWDLVHGRGDSAGEWTRPVAAIVANFTPPSATRPSLLKHDEVTTLFHEFGHVLHMCLTTARYALFSGANVEWDFVEAPSQIMEHWCWKAEVLQRFAGHYDSGEPIPAVMVDRLVAARDLNIGVKTLRQFFYGLLDLGMHTANGSLDLDALYRSAWEVTGLPFPEGTFMPAGFGHIMGGYDAGYYGYMWSKVYGDDMFSVFEAEGVLSPDVGSRYRDQVLAPGGSRDAIEHLRAFLGREPNNDAFLEYLGLSG